MLHSFLDPGNNIVRKGQFLRTVSILLISLLLVLFFGPFLIPVLPLQGTKTNQELADQDSQFIEIKGMVVHFKKAGQGKTAFILLHGFGASLYCLHIKRPIDPGPGRGTPGHRRL